ncbi:uncharacterized protein LOC127265262 [Andrographis paniculata]|uniref:uncharacterized protein LOC127265262 n=1 Tax=Andrographis paniculata TaxID=175694 RepID=UPI0021E7FEF3|nr:uncharacterized protein LOC127265262 [Andrographis paniculata]
MFDPPPLILMRRDTTAMLRRNLALLSLLFLQFLSLIHSSIIPSRRPFNISHYLHPKVTAFTESNAPPEPPNFLQGVLDAIANKEKCTLEDIRVSGVDTQKAKYRQVERYEFRVRVRKAEVVLKMYKEVSEWKKLVASSQNGSSTFEELAMKIGAKTAIDSFKIEGPFELQAAGDDDRLSLILPLNTTTYSGLRRISVGEGITIEVKGAEEILIFHPSDYHYGIVTSQKWHKIGSIFPGLCKAPLPIRILGSASVVAYRTQRPATVIQTAFLSNNSIKLLPDKCYLWPNHKKPKYPYSSLHSRVTMVERVLRNFLNETGKPSTVLGSTRTRMRASYVFHFQLQIERDVRSNDKRWGTLADWRTKPTVEHSWYEVLARIEGEVLKPLVVKKVRPFIVADSLAWSSLLSNISFTKFPSVLVPSEALTLDVKW